MNLTYKTCKLIGAIDIGHTGVRSMITLYKMLLTYIPITHDIYNIEHCQEQHVGNPNYVGATVTSTFHVLCKKNLQL